MPRVTAIISTYNYAPVLAYAIQSVLDQQFSDFELLVIGDRCTDESEEVVSAFDDPRVHWHNLDVRTKDQSGPNDEGLRRANGDIVAYLGHDDLWLSNHLRLLVHAIHGDVGFVYGKTLGVGPAGPPTIHPDALLQAPARRVPRLATGSPFGLLPPTAVAHRTSLAREVGGWRRPSATESAVPQVDLWTRMASQAGPPVLVPHITNIKIAAAVRRDVYRRRPTHEQAYWLQRIRTSHDPEAELRAACAADYVYASPDPGSHAVSRHDLLAELYGKPAEDVQRILRRYKGVDD